MNKKTNEKDENAMNNEGSCPFLGLMDDQDTSISFPSIRNNCHHAQPVATPNFEHQFSYCLSPDFTDCPLFLSKKKTPSLAEFGLLNGRESSNRGFNWKYLMLLIPVLVVGLILIWQVGFGGGLPMFNQSPTETPLPTFTVSPLIIQNSATPPIIKHTSTATPLPSSGGRAPCTNQLILVKETIPDGSNLNVNQSFEKTWLVKNVGTCTWNSNYKIVFVDGNLMAGQASSKLSTVIAPGQTLEVRFNLKMPGVVGTYTGKWKIQSEDGVNFGLISTTIKAVPMTGTPTKTLLAPSVTPTKTALSPSKTMTKTPVPPTKTPTKTPVPPTKTPTPTQTRTPAKKDICGYPLDVQFGKDYKFFIHRVTSGESLGQYADQYNTTIETILALNYYLPTPLWSNLIVIIPVGINDKGDLPNFGPYFFENDKRSITDIAKQLSLNIDEFRYYNGLDSACQFLSGWVIIPQTKY